MPKALEAKLKKEGRSKGYTGERLDHFVYGTLNKLGVMHGSTVVRGARPKPGKKRK